MKERRVVGCMTGTSLDGLDAALVRVTGEGLGVQVSIGRTATSTFGPFVADLRRMCQGEPMPAMAFARVARSLAIHHADAVANVCGDTPPDLIAAHGQTIFHSPPLSLQLLNGAMLARRARADVVFDLRSADLASGGQGAPITPLADWVLFRSRERARTIVNLGGFCNITRLPAGGEPESVTGADVCACNHVLDSAARAFLKRPYDAGGAAAARGKANRGASDALREVLTSQASEGRSLGSGDELWGLTEETLRALAPDDAAATACDAVADAIAARIEPGDEVVLAGGGARNATFVGMLAARLGREPLSCGSLGIPASYREAIEVAVLGVLCADRVPITLPAVTGVPAPAPVSGVWAYGR